jgi:hypothetical protein
MKIFFSTAWYKAFFLTITFIGGYEHANNLRFSVRKLVTINYISYILIDMMEASSNMLYVGEKKPKVLNKFLF